MKLSVVQVQNGMKNFIDPAGLERILAIRKLH